MLSFRLSFLILGTIAVLGIANSGDAQVNPFKGKTTGLTSDDLNIMNKAAQRLYQAPELANGSSTKWHNSQTGNGGVVTFNGNVQHQGLLCRKLTYALNTKKQPDERRYTVDWCKMADGSWKMR